MTSKEIIGKGIMTIRKSLGLKQYKLAKILGISSGYLSEVEAGKKNPGIEILDKLFTKYNVNITYLFTGKGSMFVQPGEENVQKAPKKPAKRISEDKEYVDEVKWYLENVPVVRFAIIEFFYSYHFSKKDMVESEVRRLGLKPPKRTTRDLNSTF